CCLLCFFFFSSRRRHTRFSRDWSSDVCSSDLPARCAPMTHSELAIKHRSQLLPPAGEIVLFRVRAHFDGDAERFEGGDRIGATWKATDGSRVTAELVKTIYATDDDAAPGQLFKVISREGSGRFQRVDWIQRTDAEGGEATYVFYGGKL